MNTITNFCLALVAALTLFLCPSCAPLAAVVGQDTSYLTDEAFEAEATHFASRVGHALDVAELNGLVGGSAREQLSNAVFQYAEGDVDALTTDFIYAQDWSAEAEITIAWALDEFLYFLKTTGAWDGGELTFRGELALTALALAIAPKTQA